MGNLVRILNEEGIRGFREYLGELRAGARKDPPFEFLTDSWTSAKWQTNIEIEARDFTNRLDAARYLSDKLESFKHAGVEQNVGLWSWLSLFFFSQVCPAKKRGKRSPGEDCRYIPELDYRRFYRHLLIGPFTIYRLYGEGAPLLLWEPLYRMGEAYRELSCRQNLITNNGVIEAANLLYYDETRGRLKAGAGVRTQKPGTLRRFVEVVQQLDLTYDLYSMKGQQVLDLLPSEFDEWRA